MNLEKAKILDAILLKFTGNITITWYQLEQGAFNDIATYHVVENNINYLVGDGQLERDVAQPFSLSMTDKGFATMTDLPNLGYVTIAKKEKKKNIWTFISGGIVVATFLILVYDTWFNSKQTNTDHQNSISWSQDSSLLNSWNKLSNQFLNRVQVFENFTSSIAKKKSIDTVYLDSLKNLKLILKEKLGQTESFDSLYIGEIKALNKRIIGFLPQLLFSKKNDSLSISPKEFTDLQTSLESAENRIFVAQKQYNEVCYKINRKDLVYK